MEPEGDQDDTTLSAEDLLQEIVDDETDPRSEDCTYHKGYVRQSVYACKTCNETLEHHQVFTK